MMVMMMDDDDDDDEDKNSERKNQPRITSNNSFLKLLAYMIIFGAAIVAPTYVLKNPEDKEEE